MPKTTKSRKTWSYSTDFKVKAVELSRQEGLQVKQVAEGLDIHPLMLSRWRKEYRDGKIKPDGNKRVIVMKDKKTPTAQELTEFEKLKKDNEDAYKKRFSRYIANKVDPTALSKLFATTKDTITKKNAK